MSFLWDMEFNCMLQGIFDEWYCAYMTDKSLTDDTKIPILLSHRNNVDKCHGAKWALGQYPIMQNSNNHDNNIMKLSIFLHDVWLVYIHMFKMEHVVNNIKCGVLLPSQITITRTRDYHAGWHVFASVGINGLNEFDALFWSLNDIRRTMSFATITYVDHMQDIADAFFPDDMTIKRWAVSCRPPKYPHEEPRASILLTPRAYQVSRVILCPDMTCNSEHYWSDSFRKNCDGMNYGVTGIFTYIH